MTNVDGINIIRNGINESRRDGMSIEKVYIHIIESRRDGMSIEIQLSSYNIERKSYRQEPSYLRNPCNLWFRQLKTTKKY